MYFLFYYKLITAYSGQEQIQKYINIYIEMKEELTYHRSNDLWLQLENIYKELSKDEKK